MSAAGLPAPGVAALDEILADWPVLAAAQSASRSATRNAARSTTPAAPADHGADDTGADLPFLLRDVDGRLVRVGQVNRRHVAAALAAQPSLPGGPALRLVATDPVHGQQGPQLVLDLARPQRDAWFAALHEALRHRGVLRGWRDELFPLLDPASGAVLAHIERAAARLWGSLTRGAHCNGIVPGPTPEQDQLWLGRRAASKSTDPGLLDNLVGGGVPLGQTPWQALQREGHEEAGLGSGIMVQARATAVYRLHRHIPEGLQFEDIHVHALELPAGLQPLNQDGEVAEFILVDPARALALVRAGELTVDASVATLDAAWRRGWLTACLGQAEATALATILAGLRVSAAADSPATA
jgi:8-oxo-dGTP pyrophosphatase MutT (NUDIX family)